MPLCGIPDETLDREHWKPCDKARGHLDPHSWEEAPDPARPAPEAPDEG